MYVCVRCKKEMRCDKNSVGADFGHGHVYAADRFKCPSCGTMILATNTVASFDPDNTFHDEYLRWRPDMPPATMKIESKTQAIMRVMDQQGSTDSKIAQIRQILNAPAYDNASIRKEVTIDGTDTFICHVYEYDGAPVPLDLWELYSLSVDPDTMHYLVDRQLEEMLHERHKDTQKG